MDEGSLKIRWAPRLRPRLLERLYDSDARGIQDLELCDDVGLRLYERCGTFLRVDRSEVECPSCGRVYTVADRGESACPGRRCRWATTSTAYWESVRNHHAHTGRALDAFARFHRRYPAARTYRDKILLIDELIHSFHVEEATQAPVKSVASKLLEGNKSEVVRFLDRLSAVDPAAKEQWRRTAAGTLHARLLSPGDGEGP